MLAEPCNRISPRAVANTEDPTAVLSFKDTSFLNNSHASSIACDIEFRRRQTKRGVSADVQPQQRIPYTVCYTLKDEVGAAGLTTVSNASFSGTTRFIGNEWGALQTRWLHVTAGTVQHMMHYSHCIVGACHVSMALAW